MPFHDPSASSSDRLRCFSAMHAVVFCLCADRTAYLAQHRTRHSAQYTRCLCAKPPGFILRASPAQDTCFCAEKPLDLFRRAGFVHIRVACAPHVFPSALRPAPALCLRPPAAGTSYFSGNAYLALSPAPYVVEIPRAELGFAGALLLVLYTADLLFCPFSCSSPFFLCPPLFPWCFFLWRFSVFFAALRRGAARFRCPSCRSRRMPRPVPFVSSPRRLPGRHLPFSPAALCRDFASFRRAVPAVLCVFSVPYPVKTETFPPGVDIFPDRVYNTLDSLC